MVKKKTKIELNWINKINFQKLISKMNQNKEKNNRSQYSESPKIESLYNTLSNKDGVYIGAPVKPGEELIWSILPWPCSNPISQKFNQCYCGDLAQIQWKVKYWLHSAGDIGVIWTFFFQPSWILKSLWNQGKPNNDIPSRKYETIKVKVKVARRLCLVAFTGSHLIYACQKVALCQPRALNMQILQFC